MILLDIFYNPTLGLIPVMPFFRGAAGILNFHPIFGIVALLLLSKM
jgi:hypothetical protein